MSPQPAAAAPPDQAGRPPGPLLSTSGLNKAFPGVVALSDVSVAFASGEVHGLVGENGAGKSTLLKIISGIYTPDSGEILWDGEPVSFRAPPDAVKLGIELIPQELSLAPGLSAAENIMMGIYPSRLGRVRWRAVLQEATRIAASVHLDIDVRRHASTLSAADVRAFSDAPFTFRRAATRADADRRLDVDGPDAEDRDDDRLFYAARHTIIMERARGPFDKTAGGTGTALLGSKSAPLLTHHVPDRNIWKRSVA